MHVLCYFHVFAYGNLITASINVRQTVPVKAKDEEYES